MSEAVHERVLPEPLVKALVEAVQAITDLACKPTFDTKHRLADAFEDVTREILAEADRRIVGYPR